jgi:hypothetical protein
MKAFVHSALVRCRHTGFRKLSSDKIPDRRLQSIYVRPEGRTLQKHEFFRNLFKVVP